MHATLFVFFILNFVFISWIPFILHHIIPLHSSFPFFSLEHSSLIMTLYRPFISIAHCIFFSLLFSMTSHLITSHSFIPTTTLAHLPLLVHPIISLSHRRRALFSRFAYCFSALSIFRPSFMLIWFPARHSKPTLSYPRLFVFLPASHFTTANNHRIHWIPISFTGTTSLFDPYTPASPSSTPFGQEEKSDTFRKPIR